MSRQHGHSVPSTPVRLATLLVAVVVLLPVAASALPVEDFAPYQPQRRCNPTAKEGTLQLARWLQRTYPGTGSLGIARACGHGGVSEHKEGRAFDWAVDHSSARDRRYVKDFLARLLATDRQGNKAALARRMGVMYLIWNDHIYASYRGFAKRDYLSSSCRSRKKCPVTLRHRNHVHISLSRAGGRGDTSWYHRNDARPPAPTPTPAPQPEPTPPAPEPEPVPDNVLNLARRPYARLTVAADGTPVRSRFALQAGETYKIVAAGLVTYGRPDQVADAACVWSGGAWRARPAAATRRARGSLNLTVNGKAVFGSECRTRGHRYAATVTPRRKTGLRLELDNTGPAASVPGGRLVVTVSRRRTDVRKALPDYSRLAPAPRAASEARRGYGLLAETVSVPAGASAVSTAQELQKGVRYRVTVSGVADLGDGARSDGRCVRLGGTWFTRAPLDRRAPDADHGNLFLDGRPFAGRGSDGGCGSASYLATHTPTRTGRLRLALWDPLSRADNAGAVTVRVQRLSDFDGPAAAGVSKPRRSEAWTKGREWFTVPAADADGVKSRLRFRKGQQVQIVVRGSVRSHGVDADAACVRTTEGWARRDPALAVRKDPLDLWVEGRPVSWRALGPTDTCSEAEHSYSVRHRVTKNGRLRLGVLDLDHRDNRGALRVTLLRQR